MGGDRVLVSALLSKTEAEKGTDGDLGSVGLYFRSFSGEIAHLTLPTYKLPAGKMLHATVGRVLMSNLVAELPISTTQEQKVALDLKMTSLATRLQLVSKYTSFVAVDSRSKVSGTLKFISANAPPQT